MLNAQEVDKMNEDAARKAELMKLEPIEFSELEARVKKWMLIADPGVIKFECAVYIANHLIRDPIWVFLIGPSGGGKTELLGGLLDLPDVYSVSLLTPNTFLSGMPGAKDASLLPKINGKTLIFKDWTSILAMQKEARAEIMGQLREIYDGHLKKPFGNGKIAEWRGKIGIIAGVTPAVDLAQQVHASLGERFLHYRVKMPDRKEVAMRSLDNGENQEEMRKDMKNSYFAFMKGVDMEKVTPKLPEEAKREVVRVANFSTMARSGVIREFGYKKDVIFVPAVEMPTRITQQLNTIAHSLMVINKGEYLEEDMRIIYKVALDSIPETNRMVMMEMARRDMRTTAQIATALGYPTAPIHMYLENLALLGVCKRVKASETTEGGTGDKWQLNEEFADILRTYENIQKETEEEQEALLDEAYEKGISTSELPL